MKIKRPFPQVMSVAMDLVCLLAPYCEAIEIAGSLRRNKPEVGDIELVATPRPLKDLFGQPMAASLLDNEVARHAVRLPKNGPRFKQFTICDSGEEYQVDLFLADSRNWGYILALRTGPAEFSRRLVTLKAFGGYKPKHIVVRDGYVYQDNAGAFILLPVPTEDELFRLWGMAPVAPEDR